MGNIQTGILVIGSQNHPLAEKCVKWGDPVYIGDFDVIVLNLGTLGNSVLNAMSHSRSSYLKSLQEQFIENLYKKDLLVICINEKEVWDDSHSLNNYLWCPVFPIFEENAGTKINKDSLIWKNKYFDRVKNWERLYSDARNNATLDSFQNGRSTLSLEIQEKALLKNMLGRSIASSLKWAVARNASGGIYKEVVIQTKGELVFLPKVDDLKVAIDDLLESLVDLDEKAPVWVDSENYFLPNEKEIKEEINKIDIDVNLLEEKRAETDQKLFDITKYKKLLYSSGKELEIIVEDAFNVLGIKLTRPQVDNIEDRIFKDGEADIPVEIRGKNSGLNEKDLNQLTSRFVDRGKSEKYKTRGIFVLNHFREAKPEDRAEAFNANIVGKAKAWDVCLLTTFTIFELLKIKLENKKVENPESKIFNKIGEFKIEDLG